MIKVYLFIISFLCLEISVFSQNKWVKVKENTGFEPRDSSPNASVVHNGSVYVLAGYRNIGGSNWESRSDTWKSLADTVWQVLNPNPPYHPYSAFSSFNGKIWAHGQESYFSEDGVSWQRAETNRSISYGSRSIVHNNALYIVSSNTVLRSVDGYNFTVMTYSAPWESRAWPGFVSFKNKLWFFGGGKGYFTGFDYYYNDVWSSVDGTNWILEVANATWPGRYWFAYHVFDQKIWLSGGWNFYNYQDEEYGNLNDTWYTSNGKDWMKLESEINYSNRHASFIWCKDGFLTVSSGYGGGGIPRMYNDIWQLKLENQYIEGPDELELAYGDTIPLNYSSSVGESVYYETESADLIELPENNVLLAKGVGETSLLVHQKGNCEHAYSEKIVPIKIVKRALFAKVRDADIFFGDPIPTFEIDYEGFAFNHTKDSIEQIPFITFDTLTSLSLGEHSIELKGGSDSRYDFHITNGKLTVFPYKYFAYIFPNPALDYIKPVIAVGQIEELIFYNSSGSIVFISKPDEEGRVDIKNLSAGFYQVCIQSQDKKFYVKLIVN